MGRKRKDYALALESAKATYLKDEINGTLKKGFLKNYIHPFGLGNYNTQLYIDYFHGKIEANNIYQAAKNKSAKVGDYKVFTITAPADVTKLPINKIVEQYGTKGLEQIINQFSNNL